MVTPQETQRNAQFQQLLGTLEQVNEMLVTVSTQLTGIANQALQIRQHLQQLKAAAPPPNPTDSRDAIQGEENYPVIPMKE